MDYKSGELTLDPDEHIVTVTIAHFRSLMLIAIAIIGSIYAYDSMFAPGLHSRPRPAASQDFRQAFLASPLECRNMAQTRYERDE